VKDETPVHTAYEDHRPFDASEPERNLMRAILRGAMEDTQKTGELLRQATQYLNSNDSHYLYSFMSICSHLELCPKTIRKVCGLPARGKEKF